MLVGQTAEEQETRVVCMDWRNYEMANFSPDNGQMLLWIKRYTNRDPSKSGLRGRAFLTTDAVYVPTQEKILKINLKNGQSVAEYPEGDRQWDESESSGNLLVTQDHLIVAGPEAAECLYRPEPGDGQAR